MPDHKKYEKIKNKLKIIFSENHLNKCQKKKKVKKVKKVKRVAKSQKG